MLKRKSHRQGSGDGAPGQVNGLHVLVLMLAFFGVIFAVNGYFLYSALSTHGGVVAVEPYRKGLAYNQRIAADQRQQEQGWSGALDVAASGRVTLHLNDRDAAPLKGRVVSVTIGRPATMRFDRTVRLNEVADGQYEAQIAALAPGTWIASADVRDVDATDPSFRMRRRLWLKE